MFKIDIFTNTTEVVDTIEGYKLLGYNKKQTSSSSSFDPLIRSVIVTDDEDQRIVCYSPPKAHYLYETFTGNLNDYIIEEFIEGTMITVFWNELNGYWVPSTRRCIGANTSFYSKKTFLEMFFETLHFLNITFDYADKNLSYCFVMQHPENCIVNTPKTPQLYLIDVYEVVDGNYINQWEHPLDKNNIPGFENVSLPDCYNQFNDLQDYENWLNICQPPTFMGIVLREKNDKRIRLKMMNPNFQRLKNLRGNHSDLLYRYIEVKKERKIRLFLKTFPLCEIYFESYKELFERVVRTVYHLYRQYFVTHEIAEFPDLFHLKKTIYNLHNVYKVTRIPIRLKYVYVFIHNLETKIQYKLLKEFF
jgi:hypothetical protein